MVGDKKYRGEQNDKSKEKSATKQTGPGRKRPRLALHSASLTLIHPYSKKKMTFDTIIPPYFETLVRKS